MKDIGNNSPEEKMIPYDSGRASDLIGKSVLVGIIYYDHKGKLLEQKQMHGTIISADEHDGFAVELKGVNEGKTYWLPPDMESFHKAEPGKYHLRSTGEVLTDPDLLTTWEIHKQAPQSDAEKRNTEPCG